MTRPPPRRLAAPALLALTLSTACFGAFGGAGCGTTGESQRSRPSPHADLVAIARDCMELLAEYRETDYGQATEAELVRQMEESALNEPICSEALPAMFDSPAGAVMASHLGRSFRIHSLRAELALSTRFDELGGYCAILEELIERFRDDANEIGAFLETRSEIDDETRPLVPLYELTLESIEVTALDWAEACR
jgi:hypothetical protein